MEVALLFAVLGTGVGGIILALCVRQAYEQRQMREQARKPATDKGLWRRMER
jgi:hypothetical protein